MFLVSTAHSYRLRERTNRERREFESQRHDDKRGTSDRVRLSDISSAMCFIGSSGHFDRYTSATYAQLPVYCGIEPSHKARKESETRAWSWGARLGMLP
jgi:hypothetical protein